MSDRLKRAGHREGIIMALRCLPKIVHVFLVPSGHAERTPGAGFWQPGAKLSVQGEKDTYELGQRMAKRGMLIDFLGLPGSVHGDKTGLILNGYLPGAKIISPMCRLGPAAANAWETLYQEKRAQGDLRTRGTHHLYNDYEDLAIAEGWWISEGIREVATLLPYQLHKQALLVTDFMLIEFATRYLAPRDWQTPKNRTAPTTVVSLRFRIHENETRTTATLLGIEEMAI